MRLTSATVRDSVRQVSLPCRTAENSLNKGAVAIDVCHHEFGIVLQHRQQLVVKHFDLTLRAMAHMDRDTTIVSIQLPFAVAAFKLFRRHAHNGTVFQIKNIELNVMQQVIRGDLDKSIHIAFTR